MRNPRIITHTDLQNPTAIRNHITELWGDYSRTNSPIILNLIREWSDKYKFKLQEENERSN
tara:strand:- start:724 stop:906 length:183 start_codon:yes stop_codon:yes gene_type:complete